MKIAFDLDKTYYVNPSLFNHIADKFQSAGHEVGILTSRNESEGAEVEFSPDFVVFLDSGELPYPNRADLKANYMIDHHINIIFDDMADLFPEGIVALRIV